MKKKIKKIKKVKNKFGEWVILPGYEPADWIAINKPKEWRDDGFY